MKIRSREMRRQARAGLIATAALLALALPSGAAAASPPLLWQSPVDRLSGSEAGRLVRPAGIAADPISGHLYVADSDNSRVSEFDAWGQFVKAWGWGVADGSEELQACGPGASPPTATCLSGNRGSGAGQFGSGFTRGPLGGVAVDEAGDVYVADMANFRVQKFDSDGDFILAFGDGVNQTTGGDVCPVAPGDVCGPGTPGVGDGQLGFVDGGPRLALGPTGTVFVGNPEGTIQAFEADGTFKEKIVLEDELEGRDVQSLAVDSSGDFYVVAVAQSSLKGPTLEEFDSSGTLLRTIDTELEVEYFKEAEQQTLTTTTRLPFGGAPLALDDADNLYTNVRYQADGERNEMVRFEPDGDAELLPSTSVATGDSKTPSVVFTGLATNTVTAAGGVDVYGTFAQEAGGANPAHRSFVAAWGPPPDKWAPPVAAPEIGEQYAVTADPDAATVRATVNPQFWADTSYRVQYGTGKCSEGGCPLQTPEAQLGAGVVNTFARTPQVVLPGLEPGTTYRFRFIAQSGGGGPVYGAAPEGGAASPSEGLEGTFTTPAPPAPLPAVDPCPNAEFRSGPSAFLPDCRAYEMVSPVDKDNGEIRHLLNSENEPIHFNQSSPDGEKLTYSSYRAFGDAKSAPAASQYMARRSAAGWSADGISPPRGTPHFGAAATLETQFRAFSDDLCQGWLRHDTDPPLTPDAVTGFPNLYRTDLCDGEQSYEALTRSAPMGVEPKSVVHDVQGTSADGGVTVFRASAQLEVDAGPKAAASGNLTQCYQFSAGKLRLVSVLPSGLASPTGCSIGAAGEFGNPHESRLDNAVSEDGSRIFWTACCNNSNIPRPGTIYLRIDAKGPSVAVSAGGEALSGETGVSTFLAAAADGSRAIYSVGNLGDGLADLYEFDTATQTSTPIAGKVRGVLGASEDAARLYLVSREALATGATEGEENLYLHESGAGSFRYIGALSAVDARLNPPDAIGPIALQPNRRSARVSEDGSVAVFTSTAPLTGFDNTDAESGEADTEVFRYDADADGGAGRLVCVSCNPSGVRPSGGVFDFTSYRVAGRISTWEMPTYASRVLSADGSRLFFESFEGLVPRDTNEKLDVYEWQQPGSGSCTSASPDYSPFNGGCVSLISSGKSAEDSFFVDASADGDDVFISTSSSLLPQDPGLIDIYDARVGGGFAQPVPPAPCQGEACQGAARNPVDVTPGSASFVGPPDPVAKRKARRCPKGKRRVRKAGKARCVPRKANKARRAGR
jgi:DNA-binding beta-propeller fold protein YncE